MGDADAEELMRFCQLGVNAAEEDPEHEGEVRDGAALTAAGGGPLLVRDYIAECLLGKGTFSDVLGCRHKDSGAPVAVKVYCRTAGREHEDEERFLRESRTARRVAQDDPNGVFALVRLFDSFVVRDRRGAQHHCMVMQRYGPNLYELYRAKAKVAGDKAVPVPVPLDTLQVIIHQLTRALAFLHDRDIVHRDVKRENVLCLTDNIRYITTPQGQRTPEPLPLSVVLGDFGSAERELTDMYRSPELVLKQRKDCPGKPYDMWCLGLTVFELASGMDAIDGPNTDHPALHLATLERLTGDQVTRKARAQFEKHRRESKGGFRFGCLEMPASYGADGLVQYAYDGRQLLYYSCAGDQSGIEQLFGRGTVPWSFTFALLRSDPAVRATALQALQLDWLRPLEEEDSAAVAALHGQPLWSPVRAKEAKS